MTILFDIAASKAKAAENDAVPHNKKTKKLNSTKPPSKPVKAIKQEAADDNAGAFPDLTNAPTHGPDEPLLLEHALMKVTRHVPSQASSLFLDH